ncbi:MAG: hypothetical protein IIZ29_04160 [Schwartzia sp.]|nr:hypothetical protein [Schwartzia sp. (in: firmicutes)]
MGKKREINVVVTYTDGYQERFTKACCDALTRRRRAGRDIYGNDVKCDNDRMKEGA